MESSFNENKKILLKVFWEKLPKDEKAKLKKYFQNSGLCQASVYRRFSTIGFQPWEYQGISSVLKEYGISVPKNKTKLWGIIRPKENFYQYMYQKGMSRPTVNTRFRKYNFKSFEIKGIRTVLEDFAKNSPVIRECLDEALKTLPEQND